MLGIAGLELADDAITLLGLNLAENLADIKKIGIVNVVCADGWRGGGVYNVPGISYEYGHGYNYVWLGGRARINGKSSEVLGGFDSRDIDDITYYWEYFDQQP